MSENQVLVDINKLDVDFWVGRGKFLMLFGEGKRMLRAVDHIDLEIREHETVGLVGESGSGKTTTGRAIAGLSPVTGGTIKFSGEELTGVSKARFRELRRDIQMVFQDPFSSLDPSWVIEEVVAEPLTVHEPSLKKADRRARVLDALRHVSLGEDHLQRYPHEFSGGQRQRIAIARALVLRPKFIIFDEAVSALDVSTQSQIINLIKDIQAETGATYLFIAHNLALTRHISEQLAVMYLGQIVEQGPSGRVFDFPGHPYTEALLSAVTNPHVSRKGEERIILGGEIPSPISPPSGCRFRTRCPYVMDVCREVDPEPIPIEGGGVAKCHLHTEGPKLDGGSVLSVTQQEVKERWGAGTAAEDRSGVA